ncbi:NADPH--quinone reductase [Corynebacterium phocae]|uniref:NADPH--quinone reductase n=1 Tax=Corynebacterium phocae TaxID=161895 RepID=A0A1L7D330_9CORY|nr:quinone oxidoreductase [Corynebacterium phocae]APT92493.1 NADPH--quinone reductase [Corynebacterium phocae]KAA8725096.1 quinone oxidoreductase [Corynebacterium phocae]
MFAIKIDTTGGHEVLNYCQVEDPVASADQALVAVDYAGVNYIDTYLRDGSYPAELPFIPGFEGCGRVLDDPSGKFSPGQRVAWDNALGSYAEKVYVDPQRMVSIPDTIDGPTAASMLLQGMTAHYLIDGVYPVKAGTTILITAGAGGVGRLATQMAKRSGATVATVVSTDAKEKISLAAGADKVFRYSENLHQEVVEWTDGVGVDVAYDGVGKATFPQSLRMVRRRGMVCLFGAASGPVEPFNPQELNKHGSLFLTRPTLADWTATPAEFRYRSQSVIEGLTQGWLKLDVPHTYPLAQASRAHQDLQDRRTTGSVVLEVAG